MLRRVRTHAVRLVAASLFVLGLCTSTWAEPSYPGWTLYAPFQSTDTYLIDEAGTVVQTWPSTYTPAAAVYLLDNGTLLRPGRDNVNTYFGAGGRGGRLQKIAWDGSLIWDCAFAGEDYTPHHDLEPLPNGNILAVVWERYTPAEAIAQGRDPALTAGSVWSEAIYEIRPTGTNGATVVWSWHVWDHLVQDFDPLLPNYGNPADHPDRIDINYAADPDAADWLHLNAVAYNAELDQIVTSPRMFNEIWVISHSQPGGLIYRWGNPEAYGRGTPADVQLFRQHDPRWIPAGYPGAGHITIFNNGVGRGYSSLDEIVTPLLPDGSYALDPGSPYGPDAPVWTCDQIDGQPFYDSLMSGFNRLPNGNNLVCRSMSADIIEVDSTGQSVWSPTTPMAFRADRIDARDPRVAGLLFCQADLNDDGVVTLEDAAAFLAEFGQTGGEPSADFDDDGDVDMVDFARLQLEFGVCGE